MKDLTDTRTLDLADAPAVRRQRGRPAVPGALSNAERQAAYRARRAEVGFKSVTVDISAECRAALAKYVEFKDMTLGDAVERILRDRLLRKR